MMRYFLLGPDKRISDAPVCENFNQRVDIRKLNPEQSWEIPSRVLVTLDPNEHTVFPDVVMAPVLMFSPEAWKVVEDYEPYLKAKEVVLLDQVNALTQIYFLPILTQLDCLAEQSPYDRVGGLLNEPVLYDEIPTLLSLFQISGMRTPHTIMRMDLMESLLCRNLYGVKMTEVRLLQREKGGT